MASITKTSTRRSESPRSATEPAGDSGSRMQPGDESNSCADSSAEWRENERASGRAAPAFSPTLECTYACSYATADYRTNDDRPPLARSRRACGLLSACRVPSRDSQRRVLCRRVNRLQQTFRCTARTQRSHDQNANQQRHHGAHQLSLPKTGSSMLRQHSFKVEHCVTAATILHHPNSTHQPEPPML